LKKFILSSAPDSEGILRIRGKDFHYLVRVRRLGPGDVFNALYPEGMETELTVLSVRDGVLTVQCGGKYESPHPSFLPPIYLFQALPKGNKMDLIVRQAAESGVSRILPFVSEYSQAKIKTSRNSKSMELGADKISRWEKIIREARQQSGSPVPTTVKAPSQLDTLLDYWKELKNEKNSGVGILLHQEPLAQGTFHDYLSNNPEFVVLAVGPEGGFSSPEAAQFMAAGFKSLQMGQTILRTETAALYGIAAIGIILLESAAWVPKNHLSSSGNAYNY
jgi:16S rRNA (uracil1498-N3)-methyltransferase